MPAPDEERASFIGLPPPARADVEALLARVVVRVLRCVEKHFKHFMGRNDELATDVMDVLASNTGSSTVIAPKGWLSLMSTPTVSFRLSPQQRARSIRRHGVDFGCAHCF